MRALSAILMVPTIAVVLPGAPLADGQCTINFENLAFNTAVTNQYTGVTFSVLPQSCGGNPTLYMRIYDPPNGTSSESKCIKIDEGCPSFSDAYVRMVFAQAHGEISFTLGDYTETYTIRYYSTTSGAAGLIDSFPVTIPPAGVGDIGVYRRVVVTSATNNIRRVEIEAANDGFEAIDDLSFHSDPTPPIAEISVPTFEFCECDNSIAVRGRACEDDGTYDQDELHYMPVGGAGWILIADADSPQCSVNGALYTWNTAAVADGEYLLRLTVYNACGLSSEAVTAVFVHRDLADPVVRTPETGTILGGDICIDGSAYDSTGCFDYYTVDWKPAVGGAYAPVNPDGPQYNAVINDPLATWHTLAGMPADGNYLIRVQSLSDCGVANTTTVSVVLDNTPPIAVLTTPVSCDHVDGLVEIRGTANDAHLSSWILEYTGGTEAAASIWLPVPNVSGDAPVVNGLLGTWDVSDLPACAYALRLRVWDTATVNCIGTHLAETNVVFNVRGDRADINCDGAVDFADINPFVECMLSGGNCPACP